MTLVRTPLAANTEVENLCGEFSRKFKWSLAGETGPGVIVQHVQRTFKVHQVLDLLQAKIPYTNQTLPAVIRNADWWFRRYMALSDIDNYVRPSTSKAHATEREYWEAWFIPPRARRPHYTGLDLGSGVNVNVGPQVSDDEFQLCGIAPTIVEAQTENTSKGKYIIYGKASYHPLGTLQAPYSAESICEDHGFQVGNSLCAGVLPSRRNAPTTLPLATSTCEWTTVVRWDSTRPDPVAGFGTSFVESHEGEPGYRDLYW